jgi:predicted esterase
VSGGRSRGLIRAVALVTASSAAAAALFGGVEETLPRGKIIDRVVCQADVLQTYALYLPSRYEASRRWPILYIFDPGARGPFAAARFRSGAEEYGFVLASSNSSKNGPVDASLAAAQAMWKDTHVRLAIDDRRIYTAGYSGGARVATLVAQILKTPVAGVIACSGGFPDGRPPTRETPFAYFATAGETDFNYGEMTALDATLEKLGLPHRLMIFPGPHQWAPEEICAEALAWMRLREAARRVVADAELVARSFQRRLAAAQEARESGRLFEADRELHALQRDFRQLRDTTAVAAELTEIERDPLYRKAAAAREKREGEERVAISRLLRRLEAVRQGQTPALPRLLADLEIARWKKLTASPDHDESLSAQRVLAMLFFHSAFSIPEELTAQKEFNRAILALSVATEIQPENARAWYSRACAEARAGQKRKALEDLRAAVAKGFRDRRGIEENGDFDSLRGDTEFRSIVESLPAEPT